MRIISGKYKNFTLYLPKNIKFRPTSELIKEALFSSLGNKIHDSYFLDVFSGSGSVGLEAVSRGASFVCFIENDRFALEILKKNIEKLNLKKFTRIYPYNFFQALKILFKEKRFFDIIFADPPYEEGFINKFLTAISKFMVLNEEGILILQHSKREEVNFFRDFIIKKQLIHGDSIITFLKRR